LPELAHSFAEHIAYGTYDWVNNDITKKRFPLTLPAGPRQLVLVHFNKVMTSQKVEAWAKDNGYEVALIDDLLAVGSHSEYKELQRQFPIVALGSSAVLDGDRHVSCLCRVDSERYLFLIYDGDDWFARCRFLLRKVS
jgi:hypothetical protein